MPERNDFQKITTLLSITVSLLVLAVTAIGLFYPLFYQPRLNAMTTFELFGQDSISLVVGLLLLLVALKKPDKLKHRDIISTGCLAYMAYVYAYFCFGLISSVLYLAYVVILGLTFFALILAIADLGRKAFSVTVRYPRVGLSFFLSLCVVLVGALEISDIVHTTILTQRSITSKDVYCILDLALLFPAMAIAAVLNYKQHSLGYALTGIFLVKTITLMPAIILADVMHYIHLQRFVDLSFDIIALGITVCASILFGLYYQQLEKTAAEPR